MNIERTAGRSTRTAELAADLAYLRAMCLGCPGCTGICAALIEATTLPGIVLGRS